MPDPDEPAAPAESVERLEPWEQGGDPACWDGLIEDQRDIARREQTAGRERTAEVESDQEPR